MGGTGLMWWLLAAPDGVGGVGKFFHPCHHCQCHPQPGGGGTHNV